MFSTYLVGGGRAGKGRKGQPGAHCAAAPVCSRVCPVPVASRPNLVAQCRSPCLPGPCEAPCPPLPAPLPPRAQAVGYVVSEVLLPKEEEPPCKSIVELLEVSGEFSTLLSVSACGRAGVQLPPASWARVASGEATWFGCVAAPCHHPHTQGVSSTTCIRGGTFHSPVMGLCRRAPGRYEQARAVSTHAAHVVMCVSAQLLTKYNLTDELGSDFEGTA